MKAAVCHAFGEQLVIEDLELAPPGPGEVRVRIRACAICHSDIHYMEGAWGGVLPAVYGHEAAGTVEETGTGVTAVRPGDSVVVTLIRACGTCPACQQGEPVMCDGEAFSAGGPGPLRRADGTPVHRAMFTGAFAEQVVVHQSQVVTIPADMPAASASLLACGVITGVGAVTNTARVPPGSTVAVIGTGGVGLNSVQGAALSGARTVIAVDLSDDKLAAAGRFGATHGVNPGREDPAEAVRRATGGRGADYVFVTVGARPAIEQAFGLMRRGGTTVIVGLTASGVMAEFDPLSLADGSQVIMGSKMGAARIRSDIPHLVELYRQKRLKLDELVSATFPLDRVNEAIAQVNRGEALRNVIVFDGA